MIYLLIVIVLLIISMFIFKFKSDYLFLINILMLVIFFVVIPKILLMFNENSILNNHTVSLIIDFNDMLIKETDIFIVTFIFLFFITYLILFVVFDNSIKNTSEDVMQTHYYPKTYITISLISVIILTFFDLSGYLKLIITYLSLLLVPIPVIFVFKKYKLSTKIYFLLGTILFLYYYLFVDVGLRTIALILLGSLMFSVIIYINLNKLSFKKTQLFFVSLLMIFTFHIGVIFQYVRWNIEKSDSFKGIISLLFEWREAYELSLYSGDLLYFYKAAVHTFAVIPDLHNFLLGDTYLRIVLFFIPSSIFPGLKPMETQLVMSSILNPERSLIGQSLPPSIIGDSYFNFGYLGVFVAIIYAVVIFIVQKYFNNFKYRGVIKVSLLSTVFVIILLYVRGTFNPFYYFVVISIVLYIINKTLNSIKKV